MTKNINLLKYEGKVKMAQNGQKTVPLYIAWNVLTIDGPGNNIELQLLFDKVDGDTDPNMWIDIKLFRPCEGSGNINGNITQPRCILDNKTTQSLFSTTSNQWVYNLWYYVIFNLSYLFKTLTSLEHKWNTTHWPP